MHCQLPARDRQGVVIVRREALGRADFDTKIADAASETIDLPFLVLLADNYGIGWATSAAQAAEDASINSVDYFPPGNQWKNPYPLRVHECGGPCEKVPGYSFRHRKYFHVVVPHLSVQLMHGSRVRMIFGTSATSDPFNTLIIAGILLKVGTRTRKRWRNFAPFPLT